MSAQPLIHPFTRHMTVKKIRVAEDGWASRSSEKVSLGYTSDSKRRNRVEFFTVPSESLLSFEPKWSRELHYRVKAEVRSFGKNSIPCISLTRVVMAPGTGSLSSQRSWEFDEQGLLRLRLISANDLPINQSDRKFRRPLGCCPDDRLD